MGKVHVRTMSGSGVGLLESDVAVLEASVRGEVIEPGNGAYDQARRVYNAMIDKHPRLIVRPADVADVMTVVSFAREHDALLAVRGGGHNGGGFGTCDDGLVIDLSLMKGIRVNSAKRAIRVESGCRWGDVDHAAHGFGLAVPSGIISTTGVAGLTLGGGHGYLTRKYGLTVDNLLEADVVLADGNVVTAGPDENEDLFWAIRGGGGNFGVVTSFLFQAHPVDTIYGGLTLYPLDEAREVMKWYREFLPQAGEDLYGFFALIVVPPGPPFPEPLHLQKMAAIIWCSLGPLGHAEQAFEPVRRFGRAAFEHLGPMPFPQLQKLFDPLYPPGLQWYWKGDFVNELRDEAIDAHLEFAAAIPTPLSGMHLYPVDGAVHRVGSDETAFAYRDSTWSMVIYGVDPDPANAEKIRAWAKEYWQALHPYSAGGAYVNFMMEEGVDRVRATYRGNYERLAAIKARYDPGNLFRVNQNIRPES